MTVAGPLSGLRVLDLTSVVMGPLCTQLLADLGADVVVVERRSGDTNRYMGPGPHPQLSGITLNLMRNKRSIGVDLTTPEGQQIAHRLARVSDVVVTTMLPGALAKFRLTYDDIRALRPDVVYAQAQGFPLDSDRANDPAYDDIVQSASGLADTMARVFDAPALMPMIVADKVCGMALAQAVLAALFHRERTGEGQHVEVPMVDATRAFLLVEHGSGAVSVPPTGTAGYPRILTKERRPQRTTDGWINVLPYSQRHYDTLFTAGGRDDLVGDPRYADGRSRIANSDFLYGAVREMLATNSTAYWLDFCARERIPASRVVTLDELVEALPVEQHPVAGPYRHIPGGARFARTPQTLRRAAPLIGGDTDEVLAELDRLERGAR